MYKNKVPKHSHFPPYAHSSPRIHLPAKAISIIATMATKTFNALPDLDCLGDCCAAVTKADVIGQCTERLGGHRTSEGDGCGQR